MPRNVSPTWENDSRITKPSDHFDPTVFVIFGGTGDLTSRKLVPALYDLIRDRSMPAQFAVIAVGRSALSDAKLRSRLHDGVKKFSRHGKTPPDQWGEFAEHISYEQGIPRSRKLTRPSAENARAWTRNGAPRPVASFTWPPRRACSAKFQNTFSRFRQNQPWTDGVSLPCGVSNSCPACSFLVDASWSAGREGTWDGLDAAPLKVRRRCDREAKEETID